MPTYSILQVHLPILAMFGVSLFAAMQDTSRSVVATMSAVSRAVLLLPCPVVSKDLDILVTRGRRIGWPYGLHMTASLTWISLSYLFLSIVNISYC